MSWRKRELRSARTTPSSAPPENIVPIPITFTATPASGQTQEPIQLLPPGSKLRGLSLPDFTLPRKKQSQLRATAPSLRDSLRPSPQILKALSATLIFAQHEAGTAVCVDPRGYLLTCSHCIAETAEDWAVPGIAHKRKWLLYYTGLAVQVECCAWDPKRDLALLKVIAVEVATSNDSGGEFPHFASASLSIRAPASKEPIICIGQPGRDDLESSNKKRTNYNLVEVSEGQLRGIMHGVDPQDNSDIGTLKHDAWTYWGHSGAPLLRTADGMLVGLHSSWDDHTAMRHGIPWVAIESFLRECLPDAAVFGGQRSATSDAADGQANALRTQDLLSKNAEGKPVEGESNSKKLELETVDLTGSSP